MCLSSTPVQGQILSQDQSLGQCLYPKILTDTEKDIKNESRQFLFGSFFFKTYGVECYKKESVLIVLWRRHLWMDVQSTDQSIANVFPLQCKYRVRCSQLGTAVLSSQEFSYCQVNSTASAGYCTHQRPLRLAAERQVAGGNTPWHLQGKTQSAVTETNVLHNPQQNFWDEIS